MTTQPVMMDGSPGIEVQFRVETRGQSVHVLGLATAAIDAVAAEREPPLGAAVPELIGWRRASEASVSVRGADLTIEPNETAPWVLVVRNPAGTAIAVDVKVARAGAPA